MQVASFGDDTAVVHLQISKGPGFVIIIVLCVAVLISMIAAGIYLTKVQKEKLLRKNRRYMQYDY